MSYIPYSKQEYNMFPRKRGKARVTVKKSLLSRTRLNPVHTLRRSTYLSIPMQNGSAASGFNINGVYTKGIACKFDAQGFTVTSLTQAISSANMVISDIQNMYDSYRIKKIIFRFYTSFNTTQTANNNSEVLPVFVVSTDTQDNLVPTSEINIRENSNHREFQITQNRYTHVVYPEAINEVMGSTGSAAALANLSRKSWLQTSSMTVPHYGWKLYMSTMGNDSDAYPLGTFHITAEYHFELKNRV